MTQPSVTAIIAAYNEADIIGQVVADLVEQGIRVHLLDHGSSDDTVAEATRGGRFGHLEIERFPPGAAADRFSLARIVARKEELAASLDSDWFVNADADEFRESPWPGRTLAEGIAVVDRLGYNAIDFAVLNFWPTHDRFEAGDDVRDAFTLYEPGGDWDRLQVRCWKKGDARVDLRSTAGHEAAFPGRSVFPVRFVLRHYPIRGQAHGERKIFRERVPRFDPDERARGWHVQYEAFREGQSFLRDPATLTPYDPEAVRLGLFLEHRGVEELRRLVEDQGRRIEDQTQRIEEQEKGIAWLRSSFEQEQRTVAERDRGLEWLKGRLEEREAAVAERERVVAELTGHLDALREAREQLESRLQAVTSSRTWRWSALLRGAADRLRSR